MTLTFKILFPPTFRVLSRKEVGLFREHLWPDVKQFSQWSETDLSSKAAGTPKKKAVVQAKLTSTGQVTSPVKGASSVTNTNPRKFSGFSAKPNNSGEACSSPTLKTSLSSSKCDPKHKDCLLREFRKLCAMVAENPSYNSKTQIIQDFLRKGSAGDGFHGDVYLTVKLLLPGVIKSVYNLNDKQIVKLFSRIFNCSPDDMARDLEQGDVSETIRVFFEQSKSFPPAAKSLLTIQEVDEFLLRLSKLTKEDEQQQALQDIASRCTANDLKCIIRLIKHDLKMNSGAKHVLDALDPNAYEAFKASRNLQDVVERVLHNEQEVEKEPGRRRALSVQASLMTPVQPMLAEACKSIEYAMKKCPNGMYSEIKYDGERVQVHKDGDHFSYFSRSLKPVLPHKVAHFKEYIPQAFPGGHSMILDSEVLLIDNKTGKPLPFGTLGVHKKAAFQDANVCLFVFDCIYFNDVSLMDRPLCERRKFLHDNMVEIPNRIMFSEMKQVSKASDLVDMINRVIREGLEGLVLKDAKGTYEPGKRHWLKVKKDYLNEGAMADTADLVVLGAFYGQGSKGGMMSIFLMGCYDPSSQKWCTVTKCSGGHDDATLARLQKELDMVKISKDPSKIPSWLKINKIYYPDFIVPDPKKAAVWEITGAEFSKSEAHTADGISIRFPRCTRIRDDKDWKSATNLPQLKTTQTTSEAVLPPPPQELYQLSKERADFTVVAGNEGSSTAGGNSGENEGTSGPAVPQKARTSPKQSSPSAKKAGGKLHHPNSKNGHKPTAKPSPVKVGEKLVTKSPVKVGEKRKASDETPCHAKRRLASEPRGRRAVSAGRRCCWTSSLGCGSTCRPPHQTSAVSDATLWHLMGTWYRNLTWPQPHTCWVAGTRTLRPSRSPQSGSGHVSGNEDWWLPARTAAFPLPPAYPSRLGQNPTGQGWTFFSKQRVFQNPPTVHGLSPARSQVLGVPPGQSPSPAGLYRSSRSRCWFCCLLVFFKKELFFLFKIKYLAAISALPPLSPPVISLVIKE
ncbi:DNA ligase 3 isoform X5 [Myotis lucifugus]|uniref:DNA ligase 3 isoform X5 n=1 Tax=Myotis lucifugus TaxID=59463 RepID=UPI000CCC36F4|nr:DNA ligase 3 isoform X5 [Myotis lucifugus]